jgi:hypothetical protein
MLQNTALFSLSIVSLQNMDLSRFLVHTIHIQRLLDMDMAEAAWYIKNGAQYSDTLARIIAAKK